MLGSRSGFARPEPSCEPAFESAVSRNCRCSAAATSLDGKMADILATLAEDPSRANHLASSINEAGTSTQEAATFLRRLGAVGSITFGPVEHQEAPPRPGGDGSYFHDGPTPKSAAEAS